MIDVAARVASLVERTEDAWRRADFGLTAFPSIARDMLGSAPLFAGETKESIFTALSMSRSTVAPSTALHADAITLYEGPRFAIRVRTAVDEIATLRSAGAAGALQLLTGPAAYVSAVFVADKEYDTLFACGTLERRSFDVLEAGAVVAVQPDSIHGVSFVDAAGAWLVMETNERHGACAVPFLFPGVRVGLEPIDHATDHRLKCFGVLHDVDAARCAALLESTVRDEDPRTCFLILRHAATLRPAPDARRLFDAARVSFGDQAVRALGALRWLARSRSLQGSLTREASPAERLLIAALDCASDRRDLDEMLAVGPLGSRAAALAAQYRDDAAHPLREILHELG